MCLLLKRAQAQSVALHLASTGEDWVEEESVYIVLFQQATQEKDCLLC